MSNLNSFSDQENLDREILANESEVDMAESQYYYDPRDDQYFNDDEYLFEAMERDPGWQALKR